MNVQKKASRTLSLLVALLMLLGIPVALGEESASNTDKMEHIFSILQQQTGEPQTLADFDRLATMAFARGEYEDALLYTDKCIELVEAEDLASLGVLWMQKASIYMQMEKLADARVALDTAATFTPDTLALYLLDAELSLQEENPEGAIAAYKRYLEVLPEDAAAWNLLADVQEAAGKANDAAESRKHAEELSGSAENAVLSQARNEYLSGNFEAAIAGYDLYLESMEDTDGTVHFLRGAAKMQQGLIAEAVEDLTAALDLGYADTAVTYEYLSSCYFVLGEYSKVIEASEKSIKTGSKTPAYDTMYQRMGVSAMALERFADAASYFASSLKANDTLLGGYYYMGMADMALEKYDDAIAAFTTSIERGEVVQRSHYNRGVCYIQTDRFDEGVNDLEETMKLTEDQTLVESAKDLLWQIAVHYMNEG